VAHRRIRRVRHLRDVEEAMSAQSLADFDAWFTKEYGSVLSMPKSSYCDLRTGYIAGRAALAQPPVSAEHWPQVIMLNDDVLELFALDENNLFRAIPGVRPIGIPLHWRTAIREFRAAIAAAEKGST
jgi:hypothetical protein